MIGKAEKKIRKLVKLDQTGNFQPSVGKSLKRNSFAPQKNVLNLTFK